MSRIRYAIGVLACAVLLLPVGNAQASAHNSSWDAFVHEFIESSFNAQPHFAVSAGRHEFDGRLPDWSAEGIRKEIARLRGFQKRAADFNQASLNAEQRLEREYMLAQIEGHLFWLEKADWPHRNPYYYARALDPNVYVTREYAPLADRMRAFTRYAKGIPGAAVHIRQNLRTPLPRTYVKIGRISFGGLATYFQSEVPSVFAAVRDAKLQADFRAANEAATKAMKELDAWLVTQEATATEDFALGADLFREMLRTTERLDIPLEKLRQIGQRDLERNLDALRQVCAAYAAGRSLADCVAKATANKPEQGPVEAAKQQLVTLKTFLVEQELVTIPGPEEALVREAPPYMRWNLAYINIPGPFDKQLPSIYYIAPPDAAWSEAERQAYIPAEADLLFTSVHEVWPGHFLQFMHAKRVRSKFGQLFFDYAFAEGWAHYSEEMMWEAGLGKGAPETRIGQLINALLRNVRYVSAIGLHTGEMSVAESEQMFREKAFQDPGNARQQAERGTFDPAYLNYTLGKLMIQKLRADWTASRGGRKAWRAFQDQLLQYGAPPVPLVRKAMMGEKVGEPL